MPRWNNPNCGYQKGHKFVGRRTFNHREETKEKIGKANSISLRGKHCSPKTEFKKGGVAPNKGKKLLSIRGPNNSRWKGGTYGTERHSDMGRIEYKNWRKSVYERDNYTCVWCGERGGKLNADHIKDWASYPMLRYDVNNGRTLCRECHKLRHVFEKILSVYYVFYFI